MFAIRYPGIQDDFLFRWLVLFHDTPFAVNAAPFFRPRRVNFV
jgi:hypothetical protein